MENKKENKQYTEISDSNENNYKYEIKTEYTQIQGMFFIKILVIFTTIYTTFFVGTSSLIVKLIGVGFIVGMLYIPTKTKLEKVVFNCPKCKTKNVYNKLGLRYINDEESICSCLKCGQELLLNNKNHVVSINQYKDNTDFKYTNDLEKVENVNKEENEETIKENDDTKSNKNNVRKLKKYQIVIIIIVIISIIAIGIYYAIISLNNAKVVKEKEELISEIQKYVPNFTLEQLASQYNYSNVDNITPEMLEIYLNYVIDYQTKQKEYDTIYTNQIIAQKDKCKELITNEVFVDGIYATKVINNNKYNISPISIPTGEMLIAEIDTSSQSIIKIGMTITYNVEITQFYVDAKTGKSYRNVSIGKMIVSGDVDINTQKVNLYYIGAFNSYDVSISQDGTPTNWIYTYKTPLVVNTDTTTNNYQYVLNDAEISFQYEDIPNTIPSGQNETIGNANNANLNGIYHSTNEEEFGETYQYRIQDETIYFLCGLETYEGTYTLNKDTLSISYTRHYGPRRRSPRIRFKRRIPNYKK